MQCEVTTLTPPTATNDCGQQFTGTSDVTLPITTKGTTVVTWTYDDGNGNTATQTQIVVIDDTTPPTVVTQNISIDLDATGNASITAGEVDNGSSDACGIASMSVSPAAFTCADVGTNSVTLTVTDVNGNSSTANATVTVNDVIPPAVITQNISVDLDATGNATIAAAEVDNGSSDACGIASMSVSPSSFTCADVGTNTVTLTVTDVNGNSATETATATVNDVTPPLPDVLQLADATGECGVNLTAPTATDNCGGTITGTTADPLSYTQQGTYNVTWTYDDGHGNTTTQTQNVVINDVTPPTITCADVTASTGTENCEAEVSVPAPEVTDNCSASSGALDFDGSNDYVEVQNFPFLNNFTLEAWVNPIIPTLRLSGRFK